MLTDGEIGLLRQIAIDDDDMPETPKEDHIAWLAADEIEQKTKALSLIANIDIHDPDVNLLDLKYIAKDALQTKDTHKCERCGWEGTGTEGFGTHMCNPPPEKNSA